MEKKKIIMTIVKINTPKQEIDKKIKDLNCKKNNCRFFDKDNKENFCKATFVDYDCFPDPLSPVG